jgi:hypothetical protein
MVSSNEHSNPRLPRQPRGFSPWPDRQKPSIAERNVARIHNHREHADGKYATMHSRAEGAAKNQAVPLAVFLRSKKQLRSIAHERTANKSLCPLRGRPDSPVRERQRLAGGAAWPRLPDAENSGRSSSLRRRNCHVNRRPREPLGGASAQRHSRIAAENRHFRSLTATRTDPHINSATALKPWRWGSPPCPSKTSFILQFGHGLEAVEFGRSAHNNTSPSSGRQVFMKLVL